MKNISTGAGLVTLGLAIAAHTFIASFAASATASASASTVAAALASAASAQAGPTVVWMGVTFADGMGSMAYHRLWNDGRLEVRAVPIGWHGTQESCGGNWIFDVPECASAFGWVEVPPPVSGSGFACRTDINGDRTVDGADLTFVLNAWGQEGGCEPDATYPCLDLANLADGPAAAK